MALFKYNIDFLHLLIGAEDTRLLRVCSGQGETPQEQSDEEAHLTPGEEFVL